MTAVRRWIAALVIAGMATASQGQQNTTAGTADLRYDGLYGACAGFFGHGLVMFVSHTPALEGARLGNAIRRHESLWLEYWALRGWLQMMSLGNAAVPGGMPKFGNWTQGDWVWTQDNVDWLAAGLTGNDVRLVIESLESLVVLAGVPDPDSLDGQLMRGSLFYEQYKWWVKERLVGYMPDFVAGAPLPPPVPPSAFFFLNRLFVPLERRIESTRLAKGVSKALGWGGPGGPPPGLSMPEVHSWFQTRFMATTTVLEGVRLYGSWDTYDWDNAIGAVTNLVVGPQVGGFAVATTGLVPLIARGNNLGHGKIGPQCMRDAMDGRFGGVFRFVTYLGATVLLTLPEYDMAMTLMANVPTGEGITRSGIVKCIRDEHFICLGGPTKAAYDRSGGSYWMVLPTVSVFALQIAFLTYFLQAAQGALLPNAWGAWGPPVYPM